MADLFDIGDVVRKLRERKGLTNLELSRLSGINKATLSKIENGKGGFGDETIGKISRGLGLTKTELYAYVEGAKSAPIAPFSACPTHRDLHRLFEELLHGSEDLANCAGAVVESMHEKAIKKKALNCDSG
jgi:transcriptional regulator with XRE-family HTH domain